MTNEDTNIYSEMKCLCAIPPRLMPNRNKTSPKKCLYVKSIVDGSRDVDDGKGGTRSIKGKQE